MRWQILGRSVLATLTFFGLIYVASFLATLHTFWLILAVIFLAGFVATVYFAQVRWLEFRLEKGWH